MNTDQIALIGCITGVISLLITLYNTFNERERIKIKINKGHSFLVKKLKEYDTWGTDYHAFVSLSIKNKSTVPTTLYKCVIKPKLFGKEIYHIHKYDSDTILKCSDGNDVKTEEHIVEVKHFDLPLRINGSDVKLITPFFVYFPVSDESCKMWLIIKSARRTYIKRISLRDENYYYNQSGDTQN